MAMNGSSRRTRAAVAASLTRSPWAMFAARSSTASTVRKQSVSTRRRFAESSRLRSSHCVPAFSAPCSESLMTRRDSEHMRSARTGLRLYAIADEPTWFSSNGSESSPTPCNSRRSLPNLWQLSAAPDSACRTWLSCLRG